MDRVDVTDLLGVDYRRGGQEPATGLDCFTAVKIAAGRVPALEGACRGLGELEALGDVSGSWRLLGREACCATVLGDLVLTDSTGAPAGVLMLVDAPARLFLTSTPTRGVHLVKGRVLRSVVGAYRWEGISGGF
jgi:hypothetical protein